MSTQADIDALLAEASSLVQEAEQIDPVSGSANGRSSTATMDSGRQGRAAQPDRPRRMEVERLLKLDVPVIVKLAERTMRLAEVMKLSLGAILEFDIAADSELSLMINNKCLGYGTAVKVGENFGLKVTQIVSRQQRVEALGK